MRVGTKAPIPAGAQPVGPLPRTKGIQVTVALEPADPAALAAYAQEVSTPGSAVYHRYLTVAEFARRFGARPAQVTAVQRALRAEGLQIGPLTANHLSFTVRGPAATMAHAFSTGLQRYRLRSGHVGYVNTSAPAVPSAIGGLVQGVAGLNTLVLRHPQAVRRAGPALARRASGAASSKVVTGGPQPCSAASSTASGNGAYTADDIASAYGFAGLYGSSGTNLGSGQTVALYELEPYDANAGITTSGDIASYQSCYGTHTSVTPVNVSDGTSNGPSCDPTDSQCGIESELDLEDVIGLAPKANIRVYQGPNTDTGAYNTYSAIVNDDKAQTISTSWGLCESDEGSGAASMENTLFQQAAVQGQSIFAASGDNGTTDCTATDALGNTIVQPGQAVDDPASQPYVTGVGGTKMSAIGPPPSEQVWNNVNGGAGGGGISSLWTEPSYQQGFATSQSSACGSAQFLCREVPDVSADADPNTGYVVYFQGGWTVVGGTSAAAPAWAALTAIINASPSCSSTRVGFANNALYAAARSSYSTSFNDVTAGNNDEPGTFGFSAGSGYDPVSGLGTPKGTALGSVLCGHPWVIFSGVPRPQSSTRGQPVTPLSLSASSSAGSGTAISYTATNLPAGLSINGSTGVISGTPTTAGSYSVTVNARDGNGTTGSVTFTWNVTAPPTPPAVVGLATPPAQSGRVGSHQNLQLHGFDSQGLSLRYSAPSLPPGLSINSSTGLISGTPTRAGRYTAQVTAIDSRGNSATTSFGWTIIGRPGASGVSLKLLPGRRPRLSLKVGAGFLAPNIKRLVIGTPGSVRLSSHTLRVRRGLSVANAGRLKVASQLRRGALTITLGRAANVVSLQLSPPVLSLSRGLSASIARHRAKPLTVTITVTDTSGYTSRVPVQVRPG